MKKWNLFGVSKSVLVTMIVLLAVFVSAPDAKGDDIVFSNFNTGAVVNGGASPSFVLSEDTRISKIQDYHWNYGSGATPGTIGIEKDGENIGTWAAHGDPSVEPFGAPANSYWTIDPNIFLTAGTYTIIDSDPSSWSSNSSSSGYGFSMGFGSAGDYSRYDFTYYYNDGSGDYYTGYVYAPTLFKITNATDNQGFIQVGTHLTNEPAEMGGGALGGYYDITAITDGFAASYDKKEYITSYYDANTYTAIEGVNSDGTTTAATVYVADRTATDESGYVVSASAINYSTPYEVNSVTVTPVSPFSSWTATADYGFFADFTPYQSADRPKLKVEVDIQLTGDDPGATLKNTWQTGIYTAWNNQYNIEYGTESYPIEFVVDWVTSGADQTVTVHNESNNWTGSKPYNMINWYTDFVPGAGLAVDNSKQGRTVAHEFGHIIGLYDEYLAGAMEPGELPKTGTMMSDFGPVQKTDMLNMADWLRNKTGKILSLVAYSAPAPVSSEGGDPYATAYSKPRDDALTSYIVAAAPATVGSSAFHSQAVWTAYWSQTASLLEEEQYR